MQDDLKKQYLDSLPGRVDELRGLLRELRGGNDVAEERIRTVAHSLYGSGTTFGFPAITEAAGRAEHAESRFLSREALVLLTVLKDTIEAADKAPPPDSPAQAAAADQGPAPIPAILIIDDDSQCATMVRNLAEALYPDSRIDHVGTGQAAQEKLVHGEYSLIILDLMLPDRDGREILREIRIDFQLATPVLILTGIDKDVIRVECMSLGADKVLTKPFREDALKPLIRELMKQGEKVRLELVPLGEEMQERKVAADSVQMDLSGKSVLVAEDDTVQASLIRKRLADEGLELAMAGNGREAMQLLRSRPFSLVILDVKMPMMTGFEVLERIRGELGKKELPVIMLTAMGSEADIIRGYDLGASDYILKPFSPVQLTARVKSLLKDRS